MTGENTKQFLMNGTGSLMYVCDTCVVTFQTRRIFWVRLYNKSNHAVVNPCTAGNPLFGQSLRVSECIPDTIVIINCNNENKAKN